MRIAAVVFDLDGTLADSLADIAAAMEFVLEARGLPGHPLEHYRRMVGNGVVMLARRALPAERAGETDALVAEFRARYRDHLVDATRLYPEIPELLDTLAARGLVLAVLSNKPEDATRTIAGRLLGRWPFAAVRGQRAGVPIKPDPAPLLAIAAEIGVEPDACLVVGDGDADVRAAAAAGMAAVGVTWGFRSAEELRAAGARWLIERPGELLELPPLGPKGPSGPA